MNPLPTWLVAAVILFSCPTQARVATPHSSPVDSADLSTNLEDCSPAVLLRKQVEELRGLGREALEEALKDIPLEDLVYWPEMDGSEKELLHFVHSRRNRACDQGDSGVASWYGPGFHGKQTAQGTIYNQNALTAAHHTFPFGTIVRVCRDSDRCVDVCINDHGPNHKGRVIDLSVGAAKAIGMGPGKTGTAQVTITCVRPAADTTPAWGREVCEGF